MPSATNHARERTQGAPRTGRPRFPADQGFRRELQKRVAAHLAASDLSPFGGWRMAVKTLLLFSWLVASYFTLIFWVTTWWQGGLCAMSLAAAIAGVGFGVQHDANHGSHSRHPIVNRLLKRTLDLLGASSYLWRWKHNVFHHTYTNVQGADHDIDLGPFARLTPAQRRRSFHRYQHIYMWALYGFTAFHMQFVADFLNLKRGRMGEHHFPRPRGLDLAEVFGSKLILAAWAIAVPLFFHPWWLVLIFYAATWFAVGLILGTVFQLAHCIDDIQVPGSEADSGATLEQWAVHQVQMTANFAPRAPMLTWYLGGLNYQIEHHLFPQICHIHYHRISPIVREVCRQYGVRYTTKPSVRAALRAHGRLLRSLGRPTPR